MPFPLHHNPSCVALGREGRVSTVAEIQVLMYTVLSYPLAYLIVVPRLTIGNTLCMSDQDLVSRIGISCLRVNNNNIYPVVQREIIVLCVV